MASILSSPLRNAAPCLPHGAAAKAIPAPGLEGLSELIAIRFRPIAKPTTITMVIGRTLGRKSAERRARE